MLYDGNYRDGLGYSAFFSDTTEDYVTPSQPDLYEKVTIRLRVEKEAAQTCFLMTEERLLRMRKAESDECFDYYEVQFEVTATPLRYIFEIYSNGRKIHYTRRGMRNMLRAADWWHIIPGFHPPAWAEGAVMYQIFVDRFSNGDTSNDVLTGEYSYMGKPSIGVWDWDQPPTSNGYREFYGGDLQGVIDRLDYLQELGVEAIYLNPVFLSPSSHKYDTQDYEHIDPHFGKIVHDKGELLFRPRAGLNSAKNTGNSPDAAKTAARGRKVRIPLSGRSPGEVLWPDATRGFESVREEDLTIGRRTNRQASRYLCRVTDPANLEASDRLFAKLVDKAHRHGIRVILDGVFNHCGSFHRWLDAEKIYEQLPGSKKGSFASKKSPYVNYFRFEKDKWPSNDSFESWWGFFTLPKLSYETSEELCEYILEIGRKWVSPPYNADGWRLDVAADVGHSSEFNHRFWKRFRKAVKEANPEAVIIAENYVDSYKWLQGDEWDTIMNYEFFMEPLTYFLTGMEKHSDSMDEERYGDPDAFWHDVLCSSQKAMPDVSLRIGMNELSNHDHSRFLTRTSRIVGRAENLGTEAALEGVNMQIMRQAVLIQMTWTGSPTIYYGDEAGLGGFTDPDNRRTYPWGHEDHALILYHKVLTGLRHTSRALRRGSLLRLADADGVLAYARFTRGKSADKTDAENGTAADTAGSGRETFIVLVNINHIPIDYSADITCAGAPPRVEFECLLRTDRSGFAADPALIPAGARQQEDTFSDRLLLPVYTSDGILRMNLPPESGILLRWKADK